MKLGLPPVHRAGWPFVAVIVAAVLLAWSQGWSSAGWCLVILAGWVASFFRDPKRISPPGARLVISPADGIVTMIGPNAPPSELKMGDAAPMMRLSIFMSIFDVHINRAPVSGRVVGKAYRPGRFSNAAFDKESQDNERQSLCLEMADGQRVIVVQIAGLIARRIVTWAREGDSLGAGERYGLIRFGSRVDVYLPNGAKPRVLLGQRMIAGETVLADLLQEPAQDTPDEDAPDEDTPDEDSRAGA